MAFAVNLEAMYAVPDMLDRLGADARRCYAYAGEWFDFEYGPGVIDKARGKHAQARAEVTGYFLAIAKRAEALARSVRISLAGYAEVDHSEAARLDSTLPAQTYHPAWRTPAITTDRLQVQALEQYEPAAHLTQVKDYLPEWPYEPEWSDLVSPGNIVRDLMMAANWLGVQVGISDRVIDPLDYVSNNLCGNWAGMRACGDALENLRRAAVDMSHNAVWIEVRVNASWQGNAADIAWLAIRKLGDALSEADCPLAAARDAYLSVCEEISALEQTVELILIDVADALFFFYAAGAAAYFTVVGGSIFTGVAIFQLLQIIKRMNDLYSLMEKSNLIIDTFNGDMDRLGGVLPDSAAPDLPNELVAA
ncbi:hypothetical protein [Catellatospora coxensis]|uniref:Uncharacterized protein n=1 Tax=Catellatospora coxensis TaxID=310354 RepID=A0A8J3KVP0_9ACTN|nr:hypothetical protein [Catellatospora coxensis]GIG04026.1 hypothetical protein Cco03nite_07260 [Catellatospora coxensis]